ncbi:alginate export family protein [Methylolobus aquaticus]
MRHDACYRVPMMAFLLGSLASGVAIAVENPAPLNASASTDAAQHATAPAGKTKALPPPKDKATAKDSQTTDPGVGKTPAEDKKGTTPPEYKRPNRWGLTAGGSQRKDWVTGKNRWDLHEHYNAKKMLGMPEWLNGMLEQRTRYETFDVPWQRGQTGGQHQIPLQTVLWLEANYAGFRAGFEFWDARQFGAEPTYTLNNTMVNVADFTQIYGAYATQNLAETGLGFEAIAGRQTMEFGSRRLVARNVFRNTTNAFTGLKLRVREGEGAWQIYPFAMVPVVRLPEDKAQLLNNDWAWDQEQEGTVFTGFFADTQALPWDIRGELYLYYLDEDERSARNRQLFTPGFRVFRNAKKGEFDFEGESIAQTGTSRVNALSRQLDHEAYMQHIQFGYTFDLPWDPRFVLQYDYASAGTNRSGTTTNSFDTLYGARRWEYGPTGIWGPFARNNINAPGARLFVVPHRDVTSFLAYRAWWMADSKALWQPANLIDPTGRSGDFMGQTVEFAIRWDAHDNISLEGGWNCLIKGDFARNAPGAPTNHDNVNYFYAQTELRF